MIAHKCSVEHVGVARSRLLLAVGMLESTRYFFVRNVFGEGRVGFVCRGGLRRSGCTHTHYSQSLWAWRVASKLVRQVGRQIQAQPQSLLNSLLRSHLVCVFVLLSRIICGRTWHMPCVCFVRDLVCCSDLPVAVCGRIICTVHTNTHTHRQSGLRGKGIQVVYSFTLLSNPHQHFISSDHFGKILQIFCMLLLPIGSIESVSN